MARRQLRASVDIAAAIPPLRAGGRGGSIILTSSAVGVKSVENMAHHVAAKHGVTGLMCALALELTRT